MSRANAFHHATVQLGFMRARSRPELIGLRLEPDGDAQAGRGRLG